MVSLAGARTEWLFSLHLARSLGLEQSRTNAAHCPGTTSQGKSVWSRIAFFGSIWLVDSLLLNGRAVMGSSKNGFLGQVPSHVHDLTAPTRTLLLPYCPALCYPVQT
jgi:hypothetical protein